MQIGELRKVFRRYGGPNRWIYVPGPEGRDNIKQVTETFTGLRPGLRIPGFNCSE
jgi:hypothetical protein